MKKSHRAWMGGSRPKKLSEISKEERLTVREMFRWHCKVFSDFWGDLPKDVAKRFWGWARYDAHATHRD